jgi:ParB-like chromosome segregation protein Spo0J
LVDKLGYGGQSELEKTIGMSQSQISELLKLLTLPQEVQDTILRENFRGRDNFRHLYKLASEDEQITHVKENVKDKKPIDKNEKETAAGTNTLSNVVNNGIKVTEATGLP